MDPKIDNASKISLESSKVLPINSKKNSEFFDDSMVCEDDWLDYDDDGENTAESPPLVVTEEIPPREDRPSSEVSFVSPKRKRTKFPNFDELLQNLNFDVLNLNFTKLLLFLESTNKELTFLFTSNEYDEFFKIVLKDINVLKSKSLDACYREICDKILKAANGYILTYVYEYNTDCPEIVMVITKEPINMTVQSEEDTSTASWSIEPIKPSRLVNAKALCRSISPTISSGFKIHCLRTMLAFIKYDETKSKEFPELSPDQAVYMELLLESNGTCDEFENNLEVKQLYRALWEAMKIYSLKYEFKIKCVDSWCGTKNLKFKKIPRQKSGTDVDSNQSINLKSETETLKTPAPDDAEPWFAKPDIPNLPPVQQNPSHLTKRLLQNEIKLENEVLFIKTLPVQFVTDTLNSILEFLLDDDKDKIVFLPRNQPELCFHRKVFDWCRKWYCVAKFGEEFERLHYKISSLLPRFEIQPTKRRANKINEITGVREVVYIKNWHKSKSGSLENIRRAPKKKKKVNLQNALELAGTQQIQLASVVNLNQSLRNKKKNKKQKKAKLKRAKAASNEASFKGSKAWTEDSSSACSSRSTSRDRANLVPIPQSVSKRTVNENQSARRHELNNRRSEEINRKEQLKEALSVPVQSDKAVRMMRGMGWSGGALGARGIGITEPLMPKLDITRGAGLGHIRGSQPETTARRPNETKTTTSWVSENQTVTETTENDEIVKKTKNLLREKPTFDSILKTVEIPKQKCNVELSKPNVELSKPYVELSKPNVELSKPNVELSKPNVELTKPNVELTKPNVELSKPNVEQTKPVISQHFSRQEFLNCVLELLNACVTHKTLFYHNRIPSKGLKFVKNVVLVINRRKVNYGIFLTEEYNTYTQIQIEINKLPQRFLEAKFSYDVKALHILKIMPSEQMPMQLMPTQEMPTQQMPTQQTPTQLSPAQQTPTQQMPTQQTPMQQTPTQQTPTQQTPMQQTPTQQTPTQQTPMQQTPTQQTPTQQTPTQQTPMQQTPTQQTTTQQTPTQQTPTQQMPTQQMPTQQTPTQQMPTQQMPTQQMPMQQTPTQQTPTQQKPMQLMPTQETPTQQTATQQTPPQQTPTQQLPSELKLPTEPKWPVELGQYNFFENLTLYNLPRQSKKIITEEYVKSFIISTNSYGTSAKANATLKFKVLFLFNILSFVKSINEESEVIFNKKLTLKEKTYIQNIVDEVNMRITFGSTPAETKLCEKIREHIADAFLGAMFNHQYTVVTLNKYYRFNQNRSDNVVKRRCQTNINLDIYKSETVSQVNVASYYEVTDKENNNKVTVNSNVAENEMIKVFESYSTVTENCSKVAENNRAVAESCSKVAENDSKVAENNRTVAQSSSIAAENCSKFAENNDIYRAFENTSYKDLIPELSEDDLTNSYDSDESSVDEYDNNNANAKVPGLPPGEEGVSLSSFLHYYEKEKTNTSDVRDASNINNVSASKMTENINNKNNIGNGNVVIDNNDNQVIDMKRDCNINMNIEITEKETNASHSEIKRSDIVTTNDVSLVNLEEKHEINNEVLGNTKDPSDQQAMLAASWEDILKNDVFVFTGNTSNSDTDVTMKDDVIEMMEVISITGNSETKKEENSIKVTEVKEIKRNITGEAQAVKQESKNLDNKTDCGLTKGNVVLSKNICATQSVAAKIDTERDVSNFFKNTDTGIKTVRIVHHNHPTIKLSNEKITEIQRHISNSIILSIQLPLLKCHGVQNGALIYTCHNEKSYDWLQNTISVDSLVTVLDTEEVTKMSIRLRCFFDCHYLYVCKMIELYNKGLSTKEWVVEKTERDGDHIIFIIKMDKFSIKFIQESGNALFAGVDKVQFSPIWE